jgi:hypothetical protein
MGLFRGHVWPLTWGVGPISSSAQARAAQGCTPLPAAGVAACVAVGYRPVHRLLMAQQWSKEADRGRPHSGCGAG